MSDTVSLEGKEYISSKRAAEISGYTQDYIGQLARKGGIDAQRVAGLWYVSLDSLNAYKTTADAYKPQPPTRAAASDPEALISFDGKDYISASRAAKVTGYHQDYVGQLARSGAILARQVGNRWYVEREALLAHKREKDALLAAVQAESVGIVPRPQSERQEVGGGADEESFFKYVHEEDDLLPLSPKPMHVTTSAQTEHVASAAVDEESDLPVMGLVNAEHIAPVGRYRSYAKPTVSSASKRSMVARATAVLVSIALLGGVGGLGFMLVRVSRGAGWLGPTQVASVGAESYSVVRSTIDRIGDMLEAVVASELTYIRQKSQ